MQFSQLLMVMCAWWLWWSVLIFTTWTGGRVHAQGANSTVPIANLTIGALFAYNSSIGQEARTAVTVAVQDINDSSKILNNVTLSLRQSDSTCDSFTGVAAAVDMLKNNVVAIVGPQTSEVAHFAADLASATKVPLVSFSATDPSLTEAANPFFVRTVHNDAVQMAAIAAVIKLYGWRDVTAISTNDGVGINSVEALSDALQLVGSTLGSKTFVSPDVEKKDLISVLTDLTNLESRVFVVHVQPTIARFFFSTAVSMDMMSTGCVWILSEATTGLLDDLPSSDSIWGSLQGVIGVRTHVPPSPELDSFRSKLKNPTAAGASYLYGLYAYDAVWMVAHALDTFLHQGRNFTFVPRSPIPVDSGGTTELASLKILQQGNEFMDILKETQFRGLSGMISLNAIGDVEITDYEIVNVFGTSQRVVGYWNNETGLSSVNAFDAAAASPAGDASGAAQESPAPPLQDVIWPGGSAEVPKGWEATTNGKPLVIGLPYRVGYREFVEIDDNRTVYRGFCIEVFEAALGRLPYTVRYHYDVYGNGTENPNYDDLVGQIVNKRYDAVVGDVTITEERLKTVDFTQQYISSGLAVVVPTKRRGSTAWAFMRPFNTLMWVTTGLFFLFTGLAVWILEHKNNRDVRGRPKKQIVSALWFIFSTPFFSQNVRSTLGRSVVTIWLFVVLIIISSYTASLSSILTVQQLTPTIQGIAGLVTSNLAIGYNSGSFVAEYLQQLNVPRDRLVPLDTTNAYADALNRGYVGAIVDELPYVQDFLSTNCEFMMAGEEFTKAGWGFAFQKGSKLAIDMSTAIVALSESGELQKIHDFWLSRNNCESSGVNDNPNKNSLQFKYFWVLFVITGSVSVLCVVLYYLRSLWEHHKTHRSTEVSQSKALSSRASRGKKSLRSLVSFQEEGDVAATGARDDPSPSNSQRKQRDQMRSESSFGDERAVSELFGTLSERPEHVSDVAAETVHQQQHLERS